MKAPTATSAMKPPRDPVWTKASVSTARATRREHAAARSSTGMEKVEAERHRRDGEGGEIVGVVVIQVAEPPVVASAEIEAEQHDAPHTRSRRSGTPTPDAPRRECPRTVPATTTNISTVLTKLSKTRSKLVPRTSAPGTDSTIQTSSAIRYFVGATRPGLDRRASTPVEADTARSRAVPVRIAGRSSFQRREELVDAADRRQDVAGDADEQQIPLPIRLAIGCRPSTGCRADRRRAETGGSSRAAAGFSADRGNAG